LLAVALQEVQAVLVVLLAGWVVLVAPTQEQAQMEVLAAQVEMAVLPVSLIPQHYHMGVQVVVVLLVILVQVVQVVLLEVLMVLMVLVVAVVVVCHYLKVVQVRVVLVAVLET
jgi:hypothetical protein